MLLCKEKKDIRKSYVLQVLRPGGLAEVAQMFMSKK
jgi:hypothetical protein